MSITITINNSAELVENLIKEKFSTEEITFFDLWKTSDDDKSFEAYQKNINPIINNFEVNLANGNFKDIFEMLGYYVNVFDAEDFINFLSGEEKQKEIVENAIECTGSFEGGELEIFKNRIKNLLNVINNNPNEFRYNSIERNINGLHIISVERDASYYQDRLNRILNLCERTNKVVWY